ncbi:MAG: FAD-binding protein, partial [Planctomycetales bacterium]|nr:FAD-binding protein [Planctomycetales bacterium]
METELNDLRGRLQGELQWGSLMRRIYATDASAYQELPLAVAIPRSEDDLRELIAFAARHQVGLIPRAAGTSLAGQVVGAGIVVDISRHFTDILEINPAEHWVRVQPGVIRNELNMALRRHGLLFGPETSTQNRAMIGGMVGNNSCGSNSVRYGSTRDHVLEVTALLSDGSKAVFTSLSREEFDEKCLLKSLEGKLYRDIRAMLGPAAVREEIRREFPKPSIPRRNTGYALDLLMDASCFDEQVDRPFHFGKLIAGSEGTLCLVTEIKLHCEPLPPPVSGLQCAHFDTVDEALRATLVAVQYDCYACELIDRFLLDCTKRSPAHRDNRYFLVGEPGAVLVTEIRGDSEEAVLAVTDRIEAQMREQGLGHAYPVLFGPETAKIWDLRKAGLGLVNNMPGDSKPASVIEDTAVAVEDLPAYIAEFNEQLKERFGLECVQYAHAGSGEIHLRPVLNLKTAEGVELFREVAQFVADLVKKYRGSLSGEHGDGRLRGEFIAQMIGEQNYEMVRRVKQSWDPQGVFNPHKIVDTPPMNRQLRYAPRQTARRIDTVFDWTATRGMLGAAEMCTGSGDCRKTHLTGGVMCPSYMATHDEQDTTRARANMLRHVLTDRSGDAAGGFDPLDSQDLKQVLDLCLSCKGCKRECPSSVDMAQLKAEFLQHYYDAHGAPRRAKRIANYAATQRWAARVPWLWNALFGWPVSRRLLNRMVGFHPSRTIPPIAKESFARWLRRRRVPESAGKHGVVSLFVDEFTMYS